MYYELLQILYYINWIRFMPSNVDDDHDLQILMFNQMVIKNGDGN